MGPLQHGREDAIATPEALYSGVAIYSGRKQWAVYRKSAYSVKGGSSIWRCQQYWWEFCSTPLVQPLVTRRLHGPLQHGLGSSIQGGGGQQWKVYSVDGGQ